MGKWDHGDANHPSKQGTNCQKMIMIKVLTKNKQNKAKINILAFSASCHANHPSKQGTNCQKMIMIKVLTKNKPNKAKINILAFSASCQASLNKKITFKSHCR